MPHKIAPWRQSVHRNASIALFRSLLLNSRKAGLEDSASDELQSVIRNRFKRSAKEQSKHHLANIFGDGYEVGAFSTIRTRILTAAIGSPKSHCIRGGR